MKAFTRSLLGPQHNPKQQSSSESPERPHPRWDAPSQLPAPLLQLRT